jgi:Family of unknown function (DUF5997)
MTSDSAQQSMKAATAAKKLGIHLPAAPDEFRSRDITRAELNDLLSAPPAWLEELRKNGPHPRPVVAAKLGVSISGLARGDVSDALTTSQIKDLLANPPAWLVRERETQAQVRSEKIRVKERDAAKQERAER